VFLWAKENLTEIASAFSCSVIKVTPSNFSAGILTALILDNFHEIPKKICEQDAGWPIYHQNSCS
jgi:hypothetical protein